MPTNLKDLKSLLSRSRSRNELKSRGEKDGESLSSIDAGSNEGNKDCPGGTTATTTSGHHFSNSVCGGSALPHQQQHAHRFDQFQRDCDTFSSFGRNAPSGGMRNCGGSCSHLVLSYSEWPTSSPAAGTAVGNEFLLNAKTPKSSDQPGQQHSASRPGGIMRKCETVITLSTLGSHHQHHQPNVGGNNCCGATESHATHGSGTSEKAKVMKNKTLSTSSSTINCLLHSTSRSKLFSGWKLSNNGSSGSSGSSSDYPEFVASSISSSSGGVTGPKVFGSINDTTDVQHQILKSQLSIPESSSTGGVVLLTPLNRLRRNISTNNAFYGGGGGASSSYSRSSSVASFGWRDQDDNISPEIMCRLCLCTVKEDDTVEISACSCRYCKDCITAYITFEIQEGADEIACPDASCQLQGVLLISELEMLVSTSLLEKHKKFRLYREVEKDGHLVWCPTPGCETICRIQESNLDVHVDGKSRKSHGVSTNKSLTINCTTCNSSFCAECKLSCHPTISCEAFRRKLIKQGKLSVDDEELFSLDCIKKCPFCHVPIEKDSGCAQMMCKKCKHVFCWYCLASLDDDFLLRHYDKGPCKNKLGHSRASVVWHRAQVIGIFAGFGVLVLLASPLLILAAPCLLCCRCRYCAKDSEDSPVHV